jgi:hypothetical protein
VHDSSCAGRVADRSAADHHRPDVHRPGLRPGPPPGPPGPGRGPPKLPPRARGEPTGTWSAGACRASAGASARATGSARTSGEAATWTRPVGPAGACACRNSGSQSAGRRRDRPTGRRHRATASGRRWDGSATGRRRSTGRGPGGARPGSSGRGRGLSRRGATIGRQRPSRDRRGCRGDCRTSLAGSRPSADDAARLVVVVGDVLRRGSNDLGRSDGLGDTFGCRFGLRCGSGFGFDDRWSDRRGLGLRFDLGGRHCSLLGRCLLRWCRRCCVGARSLRSCLGRSGGLGGCLLGSGLLDRLRFLRLLGTSQSIANGATLQPIGLCFDQRAGVGLDAHTHLFAQRHHFGVGHSELFSELVHSHVLRQNQFSLSLASACRRVFRRPSILSCW